MSTKVSDIEAMLLVKQVQRAAAAKAVLCNNQALLRLPAFLVWSVGSIVIGGYGKELAAYFDTGRVILFVLLVLTGAALFLAAEVIAMRHRMSALVVLLAPENRAAFQEALAK
jgi:hypothetical protein